MLLILSNPTHTLDIGGILYLWPKTNITTSVWLRRELLTSLFFIPTLCIPLNVYNPTSDLDGSPTRITCTFTSTTVFVILYLTYIPDDLVPNGLFSRQTSNCILDSLIYLKDTTKLVKFISKDLKYHEYEIMKRDERLSALYL